MDNVTMCRQDRQVSSSESDFEKKSSNHPGSTDCGKTTMNLSLSEQDRFVYDGLNTALADAMAESIEKAVSKGVDTLPLLDDNCSYRGSQENQGKSPKERLIETVRYKFVRNVDVLEAYCAQHLLTLKEHPPARRKRILSVLRDGHGALPEMPLPQANQNVNSVTGTSRYPSRTDLFTEDERTKLFQDLNNLKTAIEAAVQKRNNLKAAVASGEKAGKFVSGVAATLETNAPSNNMEKEVSTVITESKTVEHLTDEAKDVIAKLDGIKRNRSDQSEDEVFDLQNDGSLDEAAIGKRYKAMSPMEAYRRDQKQLGLLRDSTNMNSAHSGLQLLKEMLRAAPTSKPM